jgi:hypothetical protein
MSLATSSFVPTNGTLRLNIVAYVFEMYDGQHWVPIDTATGIDPHKMMAAIKEVVDYYVRDQKNSNSTTKDAKSTWIDACDRFEVILSLTNKNK